MTTSIPSEEPITNTPTGAADPGGGDHEPSDKLAVEEPPTSGRPWVTWLAVLGCVVVFVGQSLEQDQDNLATLSKWGYCTAADVWNGRYYGLLTSAFLHQEIWHVGFNVYWLWIFGRKLESAIGSFWNLLFIISSAVFSSLAELGVAGTMGIGASGIGYALFGFLWVGRRRFPAFNQVLTAQIVKLFLVWLVACEVATLLEIVNVANAAHLAGLIFGAGVAGCVVATNHRREKFAALGTVFVLSFTPLFWAPWLPEWLSHQAYNAHVAGNYRLAIDYYDRLLNRDPRSAWGHSNRASAYESLGDHEHAEADFKRALEIDPNYGDKNR